MFAHANSWFVNIFGESTIKNLLSKLKFCTHKKSLFLPTHLLQKRKSLTKRDEFAFQITAIVAASIVKTHHFYWGIRHIDSFWFQKQPRKFGTSKTNEKILLLSMAIPESLRYKKNKQIRFNFAAVWKPSYL